MTSPVPPPAAPAEEPVFTPLAPQSGWARADRRRRVAAVLALPLALAVIVLMKVVADEDIASEGLGSDALGILSIVALVGWCVAGPACFYSLARVLRPEPRGGERTTRHLLAGAGTAYGLVALGDLLPPQRYTGMAFFFGIPAALLLVVTLGWGLAVGGKRAID